MFQVLSLKESASWSAFYKRLPSHRRDIYFTPEYYSLYENNGEVRCVIYEDGGEMALYPFLMNPITTLGYKLDREYYDIQGAYGYNGLITSCDSADFLAGFWNGFDSFCEEQHIIAEFMRFHPLLNNLNLASPQMSTFFSRNTVGVNLTADDIWADEISSKNRNMIRKALKEGVEIVESDDYQTFRRLYDETMTDLHAESFYYFPEQYYGDFRQAFKEKGMLCLARVEGRTIAGSMFMFSDDYAHYHLSARDRSCSRYAANNLILWYALQKARERGCKWFHLGGGTTGMENDTLLRFKKDFGKTLCEFWIGKRIHNDPVYQSVVEQWKQKWPECYNRDKVKLLGYREIN